MYCFQDIVRYLLNVANFFLPNIWHHLWEVTPQEYDQDVWCPKTGVTCIPCGTVCYNKLAVWINTGLWQTQMDSIYHASITVWGKMFWSVTNGVGFLPSKTCFCQTWGLNWFKHEKTKEHCTSTVVTFCHRIKGFPLYLTDKHCNTPVHSHSHHFLLKMCINTMKTASMRPR